MKARAQPRDLLGRAIRDLRVSVTDRCNFRCPYCMPKEVFGGRYRFLPRQEILTYEEIERLVRAFHRLGVRKVRITGGEPLLRKDLPQLVEALVAIGRESGEGIDVVLTTNGSLLPHLAEDLAAAGLDRITVSLDSLDDQIFRAMNDVDYPVSRVLEGIASAVAAGLTPVKINTVVKRGVNDHTVVDLARHFKGSGQIVRFIEYMDVGTTNGWRLDDVVSGAEIVERIGAEFPIEPAEPNYIGEVARRWRYSDGDGEFGVITSVSQPFCGDCSRARLSTDGKLYTCLFARNGIDVREPLRADWDAEQLERFIREAWSRRGDRYSEIRSAATEGLERIEMSYIGG
jgi:cyclic pyranopterin phosphate synthase